MTVHIPQVIRRKSSYISYQIVSNQTTYHNMSSHLISPPVMSRRIELCHVISSSSASGMGANSKHHGIDKDLCVCDGASSQIIHKKRAVSARRESEASSRASQEAPLCISCKQCLGVLHHESARCWHKERARASANLVSSVIPYSFRVAESTWMAWRGVAPGGRGLARWDMPRCTGMGCMARYPRPTCGGEQD